MTLASLVIIIISLTLYTISIFTKKKLLLKKEKFSPFECGFDPFSLARLPFSLRFFKITIIFLIFDIEIIILLPLPILTNLLHIFNPLAFFSIILLIFIGLIFEWKKGMIEWLK
uniref:NADH dehydrogenase subunit 3 n=1 Tax=Otobius lagophilus TaxID=2944767 RepID=UPI00223807E6|nr:NADH dehydrogenase subunit 3 [Otobius lagophilus]UYB78385.1 NADH dehydrogenase subunit 3 [Otobius lagophilus]UYB78398.1 NADH dehydrogenase subunit 3 [Otobius lagophilus]UYL27138.1 NADH dehydrogenase subunit 3 [Otobius lagophilus]